MNCFNSCSGFVIFLLFTTLLSFGSSFTTCPFSIYKNNVPQKNHSIQLRKAKRSSSELVWDDDDSIVRRLFQNNQKRPTSATSAGVVAVVETATLLSDKRQQNQFKKKIRNEFRWIPSELLDICLDSATVAFAQVAPSELKSAFQQGNFQKVVRPKLKDTIVTSLESQPLYHSLPLLDLDTKRKLVSYLVNLSLDYLLKDVELVLANPFDKLRLLDEERRKLQQRMTFWQLTWYRLRFYPGRVLMLGVAGVITSYYGIYVPSSNSSTIMSVVSKIRTVVSSVATSVWIVFNTRLRKYVLWAFHRGVQVAIQIMESLKSVVTQKLIH